MKASVNSAFDFFWMRQIDLHNEDGSYVRGNRLLRHATPRSADGGGAQPARRRANPVARLRELPTHITAIPLVQIELSSKNCQVDSDRHEAV